jgi:hypothetical protein
MGEELLHGPTPIGQGPQKGDYEVVAGVEADRLRRRPNVRASEKRVHVKFDAPYALQQPLGVNSRSARKLIT